MPKRMLAHGAGALREAGHEALVADLGVVDTLARVASPRATSLKRRPTAEEIEPRYRAWMELALGPVIDGFRPNLIVILNSQPEHTRTVTMGAEVLREMCPGAVIAGWGPACFDTTPTPHTPLDALLPKHTITPLVAFADRISEGDRWEAVPSLVYRVDGAWRRTPSLKTSLFDESVVPAYDTSTYPALTGDNQFKIFEVEECRSLVTMERDGAAPWSGFPRPSEDVADEIRVLADRLGARAFHLTGCDGSTQRVEQLAFDVMAAQPRAIYTRDTHVEALDFSAGSALVMSGCCGIRIPVPTGSQRLLDDFYGAGCTVTQIELAMGLANRLGLYRLVELLYPSIEDDYHTRAETLRLIRRTNPDGVRICLPEEDLCLEGHQGSLGARRAQLGLAHAIRKCGVAPNVDTREPLLAKLTGNGNVAGVIRKLKRLVRACEAADVAVMMAEVNAQACLSRNTVAFRPFVPVRNAVGN